DPGGPCLGRTSGTSPGRLLRRCRSRAHPWVWSRGAGAGRRRPARLGRARPTWETGRMSDSSPVPSAAPVLDVWCELQCPQCRTALDDLRALRARYGDRLELRLRHFPVEKHQHAFAAAQAAEEALEQGRGWEYVESVLSRV